MKKVSVIVVTYNHENFIGKCITSILNQKTNFEYEILIGEDYSTDNTRNVIDKIISNYDGDVEIKLITPESDKKIYLGGMPTGVYNFINLLKNSTGEYIAICDGDDYWLDENKLQIQVDFLEQNKDYTVCFTVAEQVDASSEKHIKLIKFEKDKIDGLESEGNLVGKHWMPTSSIVWRNVLDYRKLPDFVYRHLASDWIFNFFHSLHGKVKFLDIVTSAYRVHNGGIWSRKNGYDKIKAKINVINDLNKYSNYKYNDIAQGEIDKIQNSIRNVYSTYEMILTLLRKESISDNALKNIKNYKNVFIYGKGSIGISFSRILRNSAVENFQFVGNVKNEKDGILEIDDISDSQDTLVIISLAYDSSEIMELIKEAKSNVTILNVKDFLD